MEHIRRNLRQLGFEEVMLPTMEVVVGIAKSEMTLKSVNVRRETPQYVDEYHGVPLNIFNNDPIWSNIIQHHHQHHQRTSHYIFEYGPILFNITQHR